MAPTDDELSVIMRLQQSVSGGLETAGLFATVMNQHDWLRLNMLLVNHPEQGHWALGPVHCDPQQSLNEQVFDPDTPLLSYPDHILLGSGSKQRCVKVLVAKQLPSFAALGQAFNYPGDSLGSLRGLKGYAQVHVLMHFPALPSLQASLQNKQRMAIQQAAGPITRFEPRLLQRKQDFELLFEGLNQGDAPLKLTFALVIYGSSLKEAEALSSSAQSYFP